MRRRLFRLLSVASLCALALFAPTADPAAAPAPTGGTVTRILQDRLTAGAAVNAADRDGTDLKLLADFYAARDGRPVWIADGRPAARALDLLSVLQAAATEGLDPADYGIARIAALVERGDSPDALAELELLLTHGALGYARDLSNGRVEPRRADPELFIEREAVDAPALLRAVADAPDPAPVLAALAPRRVEYRRLREALTLYRALAAGGGWPRVPALAEGVRKLTPGEGAALVPALRDRLRVTGELPAGAPGPDDPHLYDPALAEAVRLFQARHGLAVDGVVGQNTLEALNVTAAERVRQIELNMERWRWMPDDLGPRYLFVNLAAFTLELWEGGSLTHMARVVVGTPYQRTPVFSDRMTYLEVNPYWNVPPSIARNEMLPKLRKDPTYLARNGYTLFSGWSDTAVQLDATKIDWSRISPRAFPYKIRQEPGDRNALGRIKFMFPNQFDVYLHDTPSRNLFARANRTFSHGCIRVEHPLDLAERVLALTGTPGWDRARLDATVASGKRTVIPLKSALPIHLAYITAFVDDGGRVNFRSDIYDRDDRLDAALTASRIDWPDDPPTPSPSSHNGTGAAL